MTTGRLTLKTEGSLAVGDLVAGRSYARGKGVAHDVINDNDAEFVFVEIELID